MQILIGRAIALAVFACYLLTTSFFAQASVVWVGLFIFGSPWLINKSVGFGLRMTSYRNVRFNFHGSYGDAFLFFTALPLTLFLTLGLTYPWVKRHMDGFIYSHTSFAGKHNDAQLRTTEYYWTFLVLAGSALLMGLLMVLLTVLVSAVFYTESTSVSGVDKILPFVVGLLFNLLALTTLRAILQARIRNHIYNNSRIAELSQFRSAIPVHGFVALMVTNALAVIFSLGLAYPWAKVRKARYLCACTYVLPEADWESLQDETTEASSALAEEAAGLFDVEIGLT